MKVVLDSSVLIAASISRAGVCAELLEDVLTHHELLISDFIAEEVGRKLRDKFNFPEKEIRELRRFLERMATSVVPADLPPQTCRDPEDIPVLGTAVAANASVLVTVDKDLLALGEFRGITIVKPGGLLETDNRLRGITLGTVDFRQACVCSRAASVCVRGILVCTHAHRGANELAPDEKRTFHRPARNLRAPPPIRVISAAPNGPISRSRAALRSAGRRRGTSGGAFATLAVAISRPPHQTPGRQLGGEREPDPPPTPDL